MNSLFVEILMQFFFVEFVRLLSADATIWVIY